MLALKLETKDHQTFREHMCLFTNLDKLLIDYQKTKHAQRRKKYYELLLQTHKKKTKRKPRKFG